MRERPVHELDDKPPSPPTEQAAQYLEMREMAKLLCSRMMAMEGLVHPCTAARAMGIEVDQKTIIFEGDWEMDVLAEYSLFYHISKGKRHFEKALDREPLNAQERAYLEANLAAPASVWEVKNTRPERWELDLADCLRKRGNVTVIDRNASATLPPGLLVFSRVVDHGGYCSNTGATLPVAAHLADDDERQFVLRRCRAVLRSPGKRTPDHALFHICRKLYLRLDLTMVYY